MRFEQLECLKAVANTGSITAAAEKLYISQQAVSKSIRQLEEELGAPLVVRTKNGVVLTSLGAEATVLARHILDARDYFVHGLTSEPDMADKKKTVVYNICSSSPFLSTIAPSAYGQLNYRMKCLTHASTADEVVQAVANAECDLGLVTIAKEKWEEKLSELPALQGMYVEPLATDRIVCVKGKRYYTWEQNHISWMEFCMRQKCFYNLEVAESVSMDNAFYDSFIQVPQDLGLLYNLMEHNGVMALMPELVYRRFFSDKRFMSALIEETNMSPMIYQPILHFAICQDKRREQLRPLISMIRREVHKQ